MPSGGAVLQQLGAGVGDAPGEEQVIEDEQIGFDVCPHQRRLLLRRRQREARELRVGQNLQPSAVSLRVSPPSTPTLT